MTTPPRTSGSAIWGLARAVRIVLTHPLWWVGVGFVLTRVFYGSRGVYPYVDTWKHFYQFIDPRLLREDLWRSLWYFHAQPPLFNLFAAAVERMSAGWEDKAFLISLRLMGLGFALVLYGLLRALRIRQWLAGGLALAFVALPSQFVMESLLLYDLPVALAMVGCGWGVLRFVRDGRPRQALLVGALLGTVVLLRSLYHLIWFVAVIGGMIAADRRRGKVLLLGVAVPFALCLGWYVKNAALFGFFSSSSWLGLSLAKITVVRLEPRERNALIADGTLSKLSAVYPFRPLPEFRPYLPSESPPTGIPVLDEETKSTGAVNFNHRDYLSISRTLERDSISLIRRKPWFYAKNVLKAGMMFFRPASYYLPPLRRKIAGIDTWANRIVYGCFTRETDRANKPDPYSPGRLGWFLVGGYGMALLYGGLRIIGEARRRRSLSAESAFLFFFVFTVIYTGVIGNAMEFGENMRFRYPLDGLCLAVVAMAVRDWLFRVRRGDKRIGAGEPE